MSIANTIKKVVGPVVSGFWSHLHLFRYGAFLYRKRHRQLKTYVDERDFWSDLLGREFYLSTGRSIQTTGTEKVTDPEPCLAMYDVVRLENFQLSEWFPRCPGLYWTKDGTLNRKAAKHHIEGIKNEFFVYGPWGKNLMVSGGMGTNRVSIHKDVSGCSFRILCATSSGICEAGIPIVAPEDVCSAILDPLMNGQGIEIDIEGVLSTLPFDPREIVIPARGAEVENKLRDWLTSTLHIPRYFLFVESTLQVKKYISDHRLQASGWTLYARVYHDSLIPSFTFATFNPYDNDTVKRATDFMTEYIKQHDGIEIYTDFDEHVPRFDAKYSIDEIMRNEVDLKEERRDLQQILSWANTIKGHD